MMNLRRSLPLLLAFSGALQAQTLVIAHRGASGYLPEHTLEAKVLAHAQGADYIEQDVVMTRDEALVVFHDLTLDRMTDVASRFPGRARADGQHYVIDFSLEEIRQLRVSEPATGTGDTRQAVHAERFPPGAARFSIHTLEEEIELVQGLDQVTGRRTGLYPEIKAPWFHHLHDKDLATATLALLARYGYDHREAPVYLQSFDAIELVRVHDELFPAMNMSLKLVQLIAETSWEETFVRNADNSLSNYDFAWMHTREGLAQLATRVDGIGPALDMIVLPASEPGEPQFSTLVSDAQAAGLAVHPYTFRRDRLPAFAMSFEDLLRLFIDESGVDGVFTDHPDAVLQFLSRP